MEISQFLDLVANPGKYQQALAELDARQAAINSAIELTGKVSEIVSLREQAEVDRKAAAKTLADATEEAKTILAKAREAINKHAKTVDDREAKANKLDAEVKQAKAEFEEFKQQHAFVAKEQEDKEKHLVNWSARLADQQQEVNDRLEKLKAVMQ